jgi:hypothetical protein
MRGKQLLGVLWFVVWVLTCYPASALAAGVDVGANVAGLLKGYATELYEGIVAIVSLVFLVNRRFNELGVFLFAAIVVGWMVFAPSDIGNAATDLAKQVFASGK